MEILETLWWLGFQLRVYIIFKPKGQFNLLSKQNINPLESTPSGAKFLLSRSAAAKYGQRAVRLGDWGLTARPKCSSGAFLQLSVFIPAEQDFSASFWLASARRLFR